MKQVPLRSGLRALVLVLSLFVLALVPATTVGKSAGTQLPPPPSAGDGLPPSPADTTVVDAPGTGGDGGTDADTDGDPDDCDHGFQVWVYWLLGYKD